MEDLGTADEVTKVDELDNNPDAFLNAGDVGPEAIDTPRSSPENEAATGSELEEVGEAEEVREAEKEEGEITLIADPESPELVQSSESYSPRKPPKKSSKGPLKIKVVLLEGKTLDLEEGRKANMETVVNSAHTESQTLETDFFSVYFYDDYLREHKGCHHHLKQKVFLVPRKRLRYQYTNKERERLEKPWVYHYGVKFYVPDPNNSRLLKDDHSRFLMCLQLCDDIRANKILVDRETAIRLTAIMLQGKLGDYEEETYVPGCYLQFPQFQLLPDSLKPANYEAQIIQVHKAKAGYTPSQADAEFLSIAKDLPRYGEHLFLAKSMRDDCVDECHMVTIGNSCKGIAVYDEVAEELHVPWKDIVKISYKKDKFRIIYHPPMDDEAKDKHEKRPTIKRKFYTGERPQAKRIWRNAVEQHVFFHLDSPSNPAIVRNIFLRSSMRYSFKKTLSSARKNPEPFTDDQKDRSRNLVPIDDPEDVPKDWILLTQPPAQGEDDTFQEHQKVQIEFRTLDREPEAHRFIIHRDSTGSYEVLNKYQPTAPVETPEQTFNLSVVDENSKAARMSVCLQLDSMETVNLTSGGSGDKGKGVAIFDSERMPVVNLGSTSVVTTATVVEKDGKRFAAGELNQKYPLKELGGGMQEGFAGPVVDGSEEAEQVSKFLEQEHDVFQRPDLSYSDEIQSPRNVDSISPLASFGMELIMT